VVLPAVDAEDIALMCKALGHPARVQLLLAAYGSCYFGNLADVLPLAPSTISQHVTILKQAGLILGSADEQRVCYCVNPARLQRLKSLIGQL
jgi:ArsR family transcriptional regulator